MSFTLISGLVSAKLHVPCLHFEINTNGCRLENWAIEKEYLLLRQYPLLISVNLIKTIFLGAQCTVTKMASWFDT